MRRFLLALAIALLGLTGLGLMSLQPISTLMLHSYQPVMTEHTIARNQRRHADYNLAGVQAATATSVINARLHARGLHPIGQIIVPDINLRLPIVNGVGGNNLLLAAGTLRPGQQMGTGNYALAGHHMRDAGVLFSPLYTRAKLGMDVYVTDLKHVYTYRLSYRKLIAPTDTQVLNNTKQPIITLITCDDTGTKRLLLRGRLVTATSLKDAPARVWHAINRPANNQNIWRGY